MQETLHHLLMQNFSGFYFLQAIWSTHPKSFISIILDTVNDQLSALGAYLKAKHWKEQCFRSGLTTIIFQTFIHCTYLQEVHKFETNS